jgi:hypothetical protein
MRTEVEFLDINLTEDSTVFFPCYSLFLLLAEFKENQSPSLGRLEFMPRNLD